jgi:hypothetical protein
MFLEKPTILGEDMARKQQGFQVQGDGSMLSVNSNV